jgi:hypothetical protein
MWYGPLSYHALGRVYPRDALRVPFPRRRRRFPVALTPGPAARSEAPPGAHAGQARGAGAGRLAVRTGATRIAAGGKATLG